MAANRTDKELAFLYDLFVAPDWGERFAELVDEHLEPQREGQLLYVGSGTGSHAIAFHERAGGRVSMLAVDENEECLELARIKAKALKKRAEFRQENLDALNIKDDLFDCAIGNGSLTPPRRVERVLSELIRVTKPGGIVALSLPTASSFGEFFSVYWEALYNCGLIDRESEVENLITELPTISSVETLAMQDGLENIASWCKVEEFDFESGETFLSSPLIAHFLMPGWLSSIASTDEQRVSQEIARIINEDQPEAPFALSVKVTLVVGSKEFSH